MHKSPYRSRSIRYVSLSLNRAYGLDYKEPVFHPTQNVITYRDVKHLTGCRVFDTGID